MTGTAGGIGTETRGEGKTIYIYTINVNVCWYDVGGIGGASGVCVNPEGYLVLCELFFIAEYKMF